MAATSPHTPPAPPREERVLTVASGNAAVEQPPKTGTRPSLLGLAIVEAALKGPANPKSPIARKLYAKLLARKVKMYKAEVVDAVAQASETRDPTSESPSPRTSCEEGFVGSPPSGHLYLKHPQEPVPEACGATFHLTAPQSSSSSRLHKEGKNSKRGGTSGTTNGEQGSPLSTRSQEGMSAESVPVLPNELQVEHWPFFNGPLIRINFVYLTLSV